MPHVDSGLPSAVQTAPSSAQSAVGPSSRPTRPVPDGATLMIHTLSPLYTPPPSSLSAAPVTVAPVAVNASRSCAEVAEGVSLNSTSKEQTGVPLCVAGRPRNSTVSGSAAICADEMGRRVRSTCTRRPDGLRFGIVYEESVTCTGAQVRQSHHWSQVYSHRNPRRAPRTSGCRGRDSTGRRFSGRLRMMCTCHRQRRILRR